MLAKSQNEEENVKSFVSDFYSKNQSRISKIVQRIETLFGTKSQEALNLLGNLMNYEWQEPTVYTAIPTILCIKNYSGNPELKNLFLDKNGVILTIANFMRDIFNEFQNDSTFQDFLIKICNDFYPQNSIFQQKRNIWNQMASTPGERKDGLEKEYSIPIKIT